MSWGVGETLLNLDGVVLAGASGDALSAFRIGPEIVLPGLDPMGNACGGKFVFPAPPKRCFQKSSPTKGLSRCPISKLASTSCDE